MLPTVRPFHRINCFDKYQARAPLGSGWLPASQEIGGGEGIGELFLAHQSFR